MKSNNLYLSPSADFSIDIEDLFIYFVGFPTCG